MKHLFKERTKTLEDFHGGDVTIRQLPVRTHLELEKASQSMATVIMVRDGVVADPPLTDDDVQDLAPDIFADLLREVTEFNAKFLPDPEEGDEAAEEIDTGNG